MSPTLKSPAAILSVCFVVGLGTWFGDRNSASAASQFDSTKPAMTSTVTVDTFPTKYDNSILTKIRDLPNSALTYPMVTVLRPETTSTSPRDAKAAFVWLLVKIRRFGKVSEARVVYCTTPKEGFEQTALDVVRSQNIHPADGYDYWDPAAWLWHQVLFTGTCRIACADSLDIPRPDDTVQIDVRPEMIYSQAPLYPASAKLARQRGVAKIAALVGTDGFVLNAYVLARSEFSSLDNSALAAAYRCRFKPGIKDGKPVAVWVSYKVEFKLKD